MQTNRIAAATLIVVSGIAASTTQAGPAPAPARVIHSTIDGHPTAQVPGRPGLVFRNFWRPYASPDGSRWAMRANSQFFDSGPMLLTGVGTTASVIVAQNDAAPWAPSEVISTVDEQMGVNNAGVIAFSSNTNNGPNETDEYVLTYDGSTFTIVAQEGGAIAAVPGSQYGVILDDTHILEDGTVGLRSINSTGLPSDEDTLLVLGDTLVAREGITVPLGQVLGRMEPWDAFDFQGYQHSADGSSYMAIGDLEGDSNTDGAVVIDGVVRIMEGSLVLPLTSPVASGFNGIREGNMNAAGDWFVRGGNSDGQDWVVRNAQVIAATGEPILMGSGERFDDAVPNTAGFYLHVGNNKGDYVVGGYTDLPDRPYAGVVVLNNEQVVMRLNDPIDVDGDGFADDFFISDFDVDKAFLTDDLKLYIVVKLADLNGPIDAEAFVLLDLDPSPCPADLDGDGAVGSADLGALLGAWGQPDPADFDGSGSVGSEDLGVLLGSWGPCP
ncbi:MAG: hypothetical protein VYC34_06840 [Planctomycetota bacterium]|nr:hypothetical protein [Planctomycetota bacterium]